MLAHSGALLVLTGGPKGPFWPKTGPNWEKSSGGQTWGQIWSQLPQIGPTGLESWLPHTLAWYWAFSGSPGTSKGPVLAQNAPFGSKRAHMGPEFQIVANLSCDLSKVAREGHSANEKNFVPIRFTSSEKIPKNYKCILAISAKLPNW